MSIPENPNLEGLSKEGTPASEESAGEGREDKTERAIGQELAKLEEGLEEIKAELTEVGGAESVQEILKRMPLDRRAKANERVVALQKALAKNRDGLGFGLALLNPLTGIIMGVYEGDALLTVAHALAYGSGVLPIGGAGKTLYESAGWVRNKIKLKLKLAERKAKKER